MGKFNKNSNKKRADNKQDDTKKKSKQDKWEENDISDIDESQNSDSDFSFIKKDDLSETLTNSEDDDLDLSETLSNSEDDDSDSNSDVIMNERVKLFIESRELNENKKTTKTLETTTKKIKNTFEKTLNNKAKKSKDRLNEKDVQKLIKKKNSIMKVINELNEKSNNETIKTNNIKYLQQSNQNYQKLIDVMNKIIRNMIENYLHIIERKDVDSSILINKNKKLKSTIKRKNELKKKSSKILRKSDKRNINENENTEFTFNTESVTFNKINKIVLFSSNVLLDSLNTPNFSKNLDDFINLLNDLYINS
ncbi:hypothetical protein U3516DRAFT_832397 [Neocallimastix sp. 'constans']